MLFLLPSSLDRDPLLTSFKVRAGLAAQDCLAAQVAMAKRRPLGMANSHLPDMAVKLRHHMEVREASQTSTARHRTSMDNRDSPASSPVLTKFQALVQLLEVCVDLETAI